MVLRPIQTRLKKGTQMDFEYSDKVKELQKKLTSFMDEHIYPNEKVYHKQIDEGDRWQPTAIIEELKPKARAAGLWNLFLPESALRRRACRTSSTLRCARSWAARRWRPRCSIARRRTRATWKCSPVTAVR